MSKEGISLSVGTFNIRGWSEEQHDGVNAWRNRAQLTADTINQLYLDCLGFQEFSGSRNTDFYSKNLSGLALILGEPMDGDRYNPVAYRENRLSTLRDGTQTVYLSEDGNHHPDWGTEETRSGLIVVFEENKGTVRGERIVFVNTHLDHKQEVARVKGTKKILDSLSRYDDLPIIVIGDFNSSYFRPHDHTAYRPEAHELFIAAGFQDAFVVANPEKKENPPKTFHNYEGKEYVADEFGTWHIDWILYKGPKLRSYSIIHNSQEQEPHFPSDHYPVTAQFDILRSQ